MFAEDLTKQFLNKYKFSNHDINKFIFAVTKRCLSIWMHEWLDETLLEKEDFYSSLNTKHIAVGDFRFQTDVSIFLEKS